MSEQGTCDFASRDKNKRNLESSRDIAKHRPDKRAKLMEGITDNTEKEEEKIVLYDPDESRTDVDPSTSEDDHSQEVSTNEESKAFIKMEKELSSNGSEGLDQEQELEAAGHFESGKDNTEREKDGKIPLGTDEWKRANSEVDCIPETGILRPEEPSVPNKEEVARTPETEASLKDIEEELSSNGSSDLQDCQEGSLEHTVSFESDEYQTKLEEDEVTPSDGDRNSLSNRNICTTSATAALPREKPSVLCDPLPNQFSRERVEQAINIQKMVECCQEKGQYEEAISWCECALQSLDKYIETDLYLKFCGCKMQLYYLMDNMDEALNTYYNYCPEDIMSRAEDLKITQTIIDLHHLCLNKDEEN